jgi:hypothetical protein
MAAELPLQAKLGLLREMSGLGTMNMRVSGV